MRVSKAATIFWGVAQIGVALGAQWIRSVLDTGLAVLSLAAGPVLGAFLVGVLTTRVKLAGHGCRHGDRRCGAGVGVVDRGDGMDVVRVHRLVGDLRRRTRGIVRPSRAHRRTAQPGRSRSAAVMPETVRGRRSTAAIGDRRRRVPRRV